MEKYALLDTYFISRAGSVTDGCNHKLIDVVLSMPSYTFFAYEKNCNCFRQWGFGSCSWGGTAQ